MIHDKTSRRPRHNKCLQKDENKFEMANKTDQTSSCCFVLWVYAYLFLNIFIIFEEKKL